MASSVALRHLGHVGHPPVDCEAVQKEDGYCLCIFIVNSYSCVPVGVVVVVMVVVVVVEGGVVGHFTVVLDGQGGQTHDVIDVDGARCNTFF